MSPLSDFIDRHYRHFNAAALRDAAIAYRGHIDAGGRMFTTLAGAMSTAELGLSLAEMIRREKIHAICCTGANIEEDLFNLVAHDHYVRVPHYRKLKAADEAELLKKGLNRVTDTCIPEHEAMRRIQGAIGGFWKEADVASSPKLPHQFFYDLINSGILAGSYQIDPKDSWLVEAAKRNLPLFVPGWEDSSLGNMFAAACIRGDLNSNTVLSGINYMISLADYYRANSGGRGLGFFQIGGGIAGDFPICVVPMIRQDLGEPDMPLWSYFCQISDSTTSYGSYSGAVPNEKITWEKLGVDTPKFVVESDATICAPLLFAYVLGQ